MDVRDLKVFTAVAEAGVVTRAAAQLNTVQSNVTARLHALEQELGVLLFHRHSRGMSLTAAGTHLQSYATKILALVDEAKYAVSDNGEPKGMLRLGSMETTAAVRMPSLLISFTKLYPLIDVNFYTGTTGELVQDVLDRKLDGAFVAGPVSHRDLESVVAFEEELTIATSRQVRSLDHLIASSEEVRILMFRQGCVYRRRLETLLGNRGVAKVKVLEFGTLEGLAWVRCGRSRHYDVADFSGAAGHEPRVSCDRCGRGAHRNGFRLSCGKPCPLAIDPFPATLRRACHAGPYDSFEAGALDCHELTRRQAPVCCKRFTQSRSSLSSTATSSAAGIERASAAACPAHCAP